MAVYRYPQEVHDLVKEWAPKLRDRELAALVNDKCGTNFTDQSMKAFRGNHGYRNGMKQWTSMISREKDGSFNEDFCKWCYTNGQFTYTTKDSLLDFLTEHMPNPAGLPKDQLRDQYDGYLSQLKHWKPNA